MTCKRCPHHVRHGQLGKDHKTIIFQDLCGLLLKQLHSVEVSPHPRKQRGKPKEDQKIVAAAKNTKKTSQQHNKLVCVHYPFDEPEFDYSSCAVYRKILSACSLRNGVVPTKDFEFSEQLAGTPVTEMDLL